MTTNEIATDPGAETLAAPHSATEVPPSQPAPAPVVSAAPATPRARKTRPARANSLPVLEQLAALYPQLFGAVFLPLKRGIFHDLLAAQPQVFEREALKAALALHTRSTRYLTAVASGQQRYDLQGQAVEPMAPEHIHHALLEVFKRRQGRSAEDLRPKLRARLLQAFEASGLSVEAYTELVRSRDEAANALLAEALSAVAERAAKDEALLRAFEASAQTVAAFADMYGMDARTVQHTLERGRQRRATAK